MFGGQSGGSQRITYEFITLVDGLPSGDWTMNTFPAFTAPNGESGVVGEPAAEYDPVSGERSRLAAHNAMRSYIIR